MIVADGRVNSDAIKSHAVELGFTTIGVCAPDAPPHLEAYKQWLEKGYHGEMGYLQRHVKAKADPRHLLPNVQSVIAVTVNYNQPNPVRPNEPRIARYALGRDYHKVLHGKLKALSRRLEEQ